MAEKLNESVAKAVGEANAAFDKMRAAVEEETKRGTAALDVIEIARKAGLDIDEATLRELQIERLIPVHLWLPWYYWWPWRPLWCWWWRRYHPWYRWCCPWWWYRCHWYPF